jgi:hypothetical protein
MSLMTSVIRCITPSKTASINFRNPRGAAATFQRQFQYCAPLKMASNFYHEDTPSDIKNTKVGSQIPVPERNGSG